MQRELGLATNGLTSGFVTQERADRFLCDLVNIPEYDHSPDGPNARQDGEGAVQVEMPPRVRDAWERVQNLFEDLLPKWGDPIHERPNRWIWEPIYRDPRRETVNPGANTVGLVWQDPQDPDYILVEDLPPKLRQVWRLPTVASRKVFLGGELGYYLRGPAMFETATKAHRAEMEERNRAEKEGATAAHAWSVGFQRWSEVLNKEAHDPKKMWAVSDADAFAEVLHRAISVAARMRLCANPACPAPYFIARKHSQRYCGDACAVPAQREWKQNWWRQNRNNYRSGKRK